MARLQLERISAVWFITLGVTVLAAGILIYILLIESALGAFSIREANPAALRLRERPKIALLRSDYTVAAHRAVSPRDTSASALEGTLRSWRDFLLDKDRELVFNEITDAQLEAGQLDEYETLILPSVRAMSDQQIENIKAFMEAGGSVLATWTPGIYRPDGSWRGWSFIEEAFGVTFVDFVEPGAGNFRVYQDTFPGSTPPGVYRPDHAFGEGGDARYADAGANAGANTGARPSVSPANFPPLRGYRRVGALDITPPQADYATADTVNLRLRNVDGRMERQPAVVVTYYTWVGGDPETTTPYPYTGPGIRRFTLRGNTPLTANIPNGYRVKVQVYNPGVRMRVVEPRTHAAGFWYDFAVEDRVMNEALATTTGIVYGTYGKGRFVYMGFQRDAMGVGREDREDYVQLSTLFANITNYLQRKPIIWVHDWPYGYDAAAMLSGVAESGAENLGAVADILRQENVPGTFFVEPDRFGGQGPLLQRLKQAGDVGVYAQPMRNRDGSSDAQRNRLEQLKQRLEQLVGAPVTGYRSSQRGMFGENTMAALKDAGYRYFVPDSIGRRLVPKIMGFPYETLTRIGLTAHGDREVFSRLPDESVDLRPILFQEDITRAKYESSLYHLLYSSDGLGRQENRFILREIIQSLKSQRFWIAAGDDITLWWRLRLGLSVDIEQRSTSRIVVRISNDNGDTAERVAVSVALGRAVESIKIQPELIGTPIPTYELQAGNSEILLSIERLKPQQYRIFHIDLVGPTAGTPADD